MDSLLMITGKSPFGSYSSSETLRLASGFLALGEDIACKVVLTGNAVLLLKAGLDASVLGVDSLDEAIEMAELTDMEFVLIQEDLARLNLTTEDLIAYENITIIPEAELGNLIAEYSNIVFV